MGHKGRAGDGAREGRHSQADPVPSHAGRWPEGMDIIYFTRYTSGLEWTWTILIYSPEPPSYYRRPVHTKAAISGGTTRRPRPLGLFHTACAATQAGGTCRREPAHLVCTGHYYEATFLSSNHLSPLDRLFQLEIPNLKCENCYNNIMKVLSHQGRTRLH